MHNVLAFRWNFAYHLHFDFQRRQIAMLCRMACWLEEFFMIKYYLANKLYLSQICTAKKKEQRIWNLEKKSQNFKLKEKNQVRVAKVVKNPFKVNMFEVAIAMELDQMF